MQCPIIVVAFVVFSVTHLILFLVDVTNGMQ